MADDRLDRFIELFERKLFDESMQDRTSEPATLAAVNYVRNALEEAKAALAEEDQPAEEKPHPHAVRWRSAAWYIWEDNEFKLYVPERWRPVPEVNYDPELIAKAKAAAEVGNE